jgi:hypothetical protein
MGTRSTIAIELDDGSVQQIYCHYDGYLSGVGKTLLEEYSDPAKLLELIQHGDISVLGKIIGVVRPFRNPHVYNSDEYSSFNARYQDQCVIYARDRNEQDTAARKFWTVEMYEITHNREEFAYIMQANGTYMVAAGAGRFVNLETALHPEHA